MPYQGHTLLISPMDHNEWRAWHRTITVRISGELPRRGNAPTFAELVQGTTRRTAGSRRVRCEGEVDEEGGTHSFF
jgi:hypothetical protein